MAINEYKYSKKEKKTKNLILLLHVQYFFLRLFFFLLIKNQRPLEEEYFKFFSQCVKSRKVYRDPQFLIISFQLVSFFFPLQYRHRINLTWFLIRGHVGWK